MATAGAPASVVTYLLLASGVVPALASLALAAVLLAAVPVASGLSRRVAVNGSIAVGWVPVLWWIRWPAEVNHAAVVVAAVVGGLAAGVAGAPTLGAGVRRLLPVVRPVDGLPVLGAVVALVATWPLAAPGSPRAALVTMLPGADNYAHFHMFSTIRTYGGTTSALGLAPDGSGWAFGVYPQGFHALAASVTELSYPNLSPGPAMLTAYAQAVATLLVLGVVLMTAAAVSLPAVRERPLLALPAVVVTWTAFLWEPGQDLLGDGFPNFWLACAAAGVACLLAIAPERPWALSVAAAVGGLCVFAAHAWAPLAVLAAPAVLVMLASVRTVLRDPRARRLLWGPVAVLTVAALGVLLAAVHLFAEVGMDPVVSALGGIHGTHPLPAFVLFGVGCYVLVAAPAVVRGRSSGPEVQAAARGARLLLLVPVLGAAMCTALLIAQLRTLGTSSYYFLKLFMGLELVLAVVVPAVVALLFAAVASQPRRGVGVVLALVATFAATQSFGRLPHGAPALLDSSFEGTALMDAPYDRVKVADGILAAVDGQSSSGSFRRDYLALSPHRVGEAFYPNGWYHGILASLSLDAYERNNVLRAKVVDAEAAAPLVTRLLEQQPGLEIVVAPEQVEPLRRALGSPRLASRVIPWREGR